MKKIFLLITAIVFAVVALACGTSITGPTCVVPGQSATLTGVRYDPTDWDTNIHQGWQYSDNAGGSWHVIVGATGVSYTITNVSTYPTRMYRYWAKELTPGMGAVQHQIYTSPAVAISICSVTPVNLKFFEGTKNNDMVQLYWLNLIETSITHIGLQRSTDGRAFTTIATFPPKGENILYQFTDTVAASLYAGKIVYYRLIIGDNDGLSYYSHIVKIVLQGKDLVITMGPTPTNDIIRIYQQGRYVDISTSRIQILDIVGRVLIFQPFGIGEVSLGTLPPGFYFCKIIGPANEIIAVRKIQKQ